MVSIKSSLADRPAVSRNVITTRASDKCSSIGAFRGLMLVRDEDDIIEECLQHLLTWIDAIYILDLGSTDHTWEIVCDIAHRDSRVVPFKSEPYLFNNHLRGLLFDQFRSHFHGGDWILRLDADEFYNVAPPEFVRTRLSRYETCVFCGWYFFRLTSTEVASYESGDIELMADRRRRIIDRRRFYKITDHAEPRMFRYRRTMKWPRSASLPYHAGYVARERLPIRHYPHRDPLQMEKRYSLRSLMMEHKADAFPQWRLREWQKDVIDFDRVSGIATERTVHGEGLSAVAGHTTGPLYEWKQGELLPPITGRNHLQPWPRRLVQRCIHRMCLPVLDRVRQPWAAGFEPERLPNA